MVSDDAEARREALLAYNNSLAQWATAGWTTDLEAFAQLAEYGASLIPQSFASVSGLYGIPHDLRAKTLIDDLYSILVINRPPLVVGGDRQEKAVDFGQTGYAWIFQDPTAGFNQANHFWYYVSQGAIGKGIGSIGNWTHEVFLTNDLNGRSYQDYALGNEGLFLGAGLASGGIQIRDVGSYIRNNLGPNSPKMSYWIGGSGSGERLQFYALSVAIRDAIFGR
jgi:hypothetical protein